MKLLLAFVKSKENSSLPDLMFDGTKGGELGGEFFPICGLWDDSELVVYGERIYNRKMSRDRDASWVTQGGRWVRR